MNLEDLSSLQQQLLLKGRINTSLFLRVMLFRVGQIQ